MDKLKKRLFIILLLLLSAGLAGIFVFVTNLLRQHTAVTEKAPAVETQQPPQRPAEPEPARTETAQPIEVAEPTAPTAELTALPKDEAELTRLELEELKPFFKDEGHLKTAWGLYKNAFTRGPAYAVGINYFNRQRAKGEISAQEQEAKKQAYKETLDRMWQRRAERNRMQEPRLESVPHGSGVQTASAQPTWTEAPCENAILPPNSPQNLTCRWGDKGFCAFFDNNRPYFCRTNNAQTRYQLNRWGSSITVTQKTPLGQPLSERYYANDKLARATDYDAKSNLVTQVWFDENNSFRMTQTDSNGKVLDKYYFTAGKPYVRYPGGNDMGEINGPWELKNGQIFTDGKPLYTLPGPKLAPDVCLIFNGYCPLPAMPDAPKEFPEPIFPPSSTK